MAEIALESGVPLGELYGFYPSKSALLEAVGSLANQAILAEPLNERMAEPVKDRLFDAFMVHFEALLPYRKGLRAVVRDARCDPLLALWSLGALSRSLRLILEASGLSTTGLGGGLCVAAVMPIYLRAFRAWLDDDSDDLSKTMSRMDRDSSRLDQNLNLKL